MSKKYHICIHGAGGLGSVIGGYLAQTGQQVTLIGRQAHVDAIKNNGLLIKGIRGDVLVKENLNAVTHPNEVEGEIDYYILLTKAKGTQSALDDAKGLVDRTACALTLQNGIEKEGALKDYFGKDKVIGASIMEGAVMLEPGTVMNHMTVPTTAYFGELEGGISERTSELSRLFNDAGLGAKAVEDINHVLWEKLIQVGGASSWSASSLPGLPELDFSDGISNRSGAEHYVAIAKELIQFYKQLGYSPQNFFAPVSRLIELDEAGFDEAVGFMMQMGPHLKEKSGDKKIRTSMHEDVLAARKTEVDVILKPIVDKAKQLGIPIPTFLGAYRVIKTLDDFF